VAPKYSLRSRLVASFLGLLPVWEFSCVRIPILRYHLRRITRATSPYRCRHGRVTPSLCSRPISFSISPPEVIVTSRRRARSVAAWYAQVGLGHSIGLGYVILTLRELSDCRSRGSRHERAPRSLRSLASSRVVTSPASTTAEHRVRVRDTSGRRPRRPRAGRRRPLYARPDAPRDLAAFFRWPPGLLRHPRAAAVGRGRLKGIRGSLKAGEG
jgi:hypothetical protein